MPIDGRFVTRSIPCRRWSFATRYGWREHGRWPTSMMVSWSDLPAILSPPYSSAEREFVFSLLVLGGISTTSATQASDKIDAQLALRHLLVRYFRVLDRRGER